MPSIQLNAETRIQNTQMMKPKIAVSIPVNNNYDDGDDSSNNGKKSKRSLFNKMQRSSPKLVKTFDEMTVSQKIAYFNSLSDKEKLNLMNKSYKSTLGYVNSLSDEQKAAFLSKLDSAVNQAQNGNTPNPSGSDDDSDSGITNIMMILVKAFINNMNTDALDELQKTFEANLINKYLQNIQNQMKTQIAKQEKLAAKMSGKSGFWSKGNKIMLGISIGIAVLGVAAIFFPPAEIIAGIGEGAMDLASTVSDTVTTTLNDAGKPLMNAFKSADELGADGTLASDKIPEGAPILEEEEENSLSGKENTESIEKADQNRGWSRIKKATGDNWNKNIRGIEKNPEWNSKLTAEEKAKIPEYLEPNIVTGIKYVGKGVVKSLVAGGGTFMAGTTILSLTSPNGQQNEQNQITDCQSEISSGTSASDILNNNEQQDSKRISDDSARISQASGYVSQAINMLGSAMSFRV